MEQVNSFCVVLCGVCLLHSDSKANGTQWPVAKTTHRRKFGEQFVWKSGEKCSGNYTTTFIPKSCVGIYVWRRTAEHFETIERE